jgi:AcrR family transcriptional regulator
VARIPQARRLKKEQTRRAIAAAALSLFEAKGFEGTTMDQIAVAAGISRPTVFNHFARKEDILEVVGDLLRERVGSQIQQLHRDGTLADPLASLRNVLVAMAGAFSEYPRTARLFHQYKMQGWSEATPVPVQEERNVIRLLVEAAQGREEVRSDFSSQEITDHLMIGLFAATVGPWLAGHYPDVTLEQLIDRHLDLYMGGIARTVSSPEARSRHPRPRA